MSEIKVNKISPRTACGTVTLGDSGDTIAIGAGVTTSGMGRTGTVDWQTTPKTGDFTAANGEGYFVNTTSGAVTMTMPSGSAGAIVSIQDYNKTFDTNNFTITPASGEKINGGVASASLTITTEGQGLTFVYVDSTVGWKTVHENEFTLGGSEFITATGGTITTSGDCKIHTFTGPGTFCVSAGGNPTNGVISYMVVAGGGGGACGRANNNCGAGGGGAGGFREFKSPVTPYTASPLDGNPGGTSISITDVTAIPVTVGAGGVGASGPGPNALSPVRPTSGSNSIFSTVTSTGGGRGGSGDGSGKCAEFCGAAGGSGGGTGKSGTSVGAGNTPPVSPSQGFPGGAGIDPGTARGSGGGGGATAAGQAGQPGGGGAGGAGATTSINGTPTARAGGGGGGGTSGETAAGGGGTGGGGAGGSHPSASCTSAGSGAAGTTNTGGGGGGMGSGGPPGASSSVSGNGGSGIVIIRYKFQ